MATATAQSEPWWDMFLPFDPASAGRSLAGLNGGISDWLAGVGGDIASGLETAFVAFFGDLWDVISGPVYVLIGVVILMFTLGFAFRNQIIQIGTIAAMAAA